MDVTGLDRWYSIEEYDPEGKELASIIKLGKVGGRKVLITGAYGALSTSSKIAAYTDSLTVVNSSRKIIEYCKKKNKGIDFMVGNISKLAFPDNTFEAVLCLWGGMHYMKNKTAVIKELKRVLKDMGILLIEESDESSEYVKILDMIAPKRKSKIKDKRDELKRVLESNFDVAERSLRTYYYFKDKKQFKGYFKKEITYDEKKKFTKGMEERLDGCISQKNALRVEEKSFFFVCKKK